MYGTNIRKMLDLWNPHSNVILIVAPLTYSMYFIEEGLYTIYSYFTDPHKIVQIYVKCAVC